MNVQNATCMCKLFVDYACSGGLGYKRSETTFFSVTRKHTILYETTDVSSLLTGLLLCIGCRVGKPQSFPILCGTDIKRFWRHSSCSCGCHFWCLIKQKVKSVKNLGKYKKRVCTEFLCMSSKTVFILIFKKGPEPTLGLRVNCMAWHGLHPYG